VQHERIAIGVQRLYEDTRAQQRSITARYRLQQLLELLRWQEVLRRRPEHQFVGFGEEDLAPLLQSRQRVRAQGVERVESGLVRGLAELEELFPARSEPVGDLQERGLPATRPIAPPPGGQGMQNVVTMIEQAGKAQDQPCRLQDRT